MAELTNSKFGDDLKVVIAGIVADITAACPDVQKIYVDRSLNEAAHSRFAVVVPGGVQMGFEEASLPTVLQSASFSIYWVEKVTDDDAVIANKIDRADAIIDQLMAAIHYLGIYELPMVPRVIFAEQEPSRDRSILQIDFTVRWVNWRHAALS